MSDHIHIVHTGDSGAGGVLSVKHLMATEFKIKGVLGEQEMLGVVTVQHEHSQHVDHGWVHRYVLRINGITLAERLIKSDVAKAWGGPIMSGAAEIGKVRKKVHKRVWMDGYANEEITGGEGHETS